MKKLLYLLLSFFSGDDPTRVLFVIAIIWLLIICLLLIVFFIWWQVVEEKVEEQPIWYLVTTVLRGQVGPGSPSEFFLLLHLLHLLLLPWTTTTLALPSRFLLKPSSELIILCCFDCFCCHCFILFWSSTGCLKNKSWRVTIETLVIPLLFCVVFRWFSFCVDF